MSEYRLPTVSINAQFSSAVPSYKTINNLPNTAWWRQFDDALLNQYIELGLSHNPDIPIAMANLESARGALLQVKLSWLPNVNLLGGYSMNPSLGLPGGFYGVFPSYLLNIATLWKRQQQASLGVDYSAAMVDGVRLTVIGQTAATYFTLMAMREQLQLLNALNHHLQELVRLYQRDIQIGLKNDIDRAPFLVDKRLVMAELQLVKKNIVSSENALRYLLGKNPGRMASKRDFSHIDFDAVKPASLPASVLQNRPDVRMAALGLQQARAGVDLAYAEWFPGLQLGEWIGNSHLPHNTFSTFTDAYLKDSLAPNTLGDILVSKGVYRASVFTYVKTIRKVLNDVDSDFSTYIHVTQHYQDVCLAEKANHHQYQLQQGLFNIGLIAYQDLLMSRVALDKLALIKNDAHLQVALSLVLLYQDLAGGYRL